jgi:colanic acid biosynthesis glycosyl transferase WcaI
MHYISTGGYRSEFGAAAASVVAMYSGNMGEKQGLELVIEAARQLQEDTRIIFVLCGTGAAYKRLRVQADGLENIRWIPLQPFEKLNELLNAADIHLLPQMASAADLVMPSKLSAIFASGRPVVATADPGTAVYEAVKGKGVVVPPGDLKAFVGALTDLAANREKRLSLGCAARNFAVRHLDRELILRRFEEVLLAL